MELSLTLTPAQKEQKKNKLNSEYNSTIYNNEYFKEAKFQDATTLVSRFTKLKEFSAHRTLPQLTTLDLENNSLSSIDLAANKNLNFLNLAYNQLTSITLDHLANLTVLFLNRNKISKINLASNQHLAWIRLESNGLE